ncbi:MAG: ABC transporter permease [Acidobacteriia bacterium]|nr:ABC transporter permease [Terriglobia bacterium]
MPPLAQRNLFRDKVRLTVTLTGIVFAVVLITVQIGMFIGFASTTSGLIDHSGVDIWIGAKHVPYIDQASPFSERKLYQVLATPGVEDAQKYILGWGDWQRPDGGHEGTQVVGFNPDSKYGAPWNVVVGRVEDLKQPDAVMIDQFYAPRLGVTQVGQTFEIYGRRAHVVGFTKGIRTFTTMPYVFTTFKNAQGYVRLKADQTIYILVKAKPGVNVQKLQHDLEQRVRGVDVYTTPEFRDKTRFYWMFSTGAGIAVLLAALLGLVVGVVVVAQTIYATTMDHLREYGTLKAMGASNGYIYRVIIKQAVISALLGYLAGMAVSVFVVHASKTGGASIILPWPMGVGMLGLTLLMCVVAAIVSINKVTRIDPAMVFKG